MFDGKERIRQVLSHHGCLESDSLESDHEKWQNSNFLVDWIATSLSGQLESTDFDSEELSLSRHAPRE